MEQYPECVQSALRHFDECNSVQELTLEEVMMCKFKKPCRRVEPGSREVRRFGQGSLLVKEDEVILVLRAEDNTMYFSFQRLILVGTPCRRFKGLLQGSSLYIRGRRRVRLLSPENAHQWRQAFTALRGEQDSATDALLDEKEGFRHHFRCDEALGLKGKKSASRLMKGLTKKEGE